MAKKGFVKNTVAGTRRGSKYPEHIKRECLYALIYEPNICKIAKRYNVPESTIRSWKNKAPDEVKKELISGRDSELRNLNYKATFGARMTGDLLQRKLEAGARNEERIQELDEQRLLIENDDNLNITEKAEKLALIDIAMGKVRTLSPYAATNILNSLTSAVARSREMLGDNDKIKDTELKINITVV